MEIRQPHRRRRVPSPQRRRCNRRASTSSGTQKISWFVSGRKGPGWDSTPSYGLAQFLGSFLRRLWRGFCEQSETSRFPCVCQLRFSEWSRVVDRAVSCAPIQHVRYPVRRYRVASCASISIQYGGIQSVESHHVRPSSTAVSCASIHIHWCCDERRVVTVWSRPLATTL